ncbi:MAG: FGGY-family carbohydrate kinase [Promethearchaeota archaeon]
MGDPLTCIFDVGTTGARTVIFDTNGKEIAKAYEEYPSVKQPVGISEQDPKIWWNAVKHTCNEVVKKINPNDIVAITATFLRETLTFLDKDLNVLHPAMTWLDEREETSAKDWTKEDGLRRAIPKVLWMKKNKPEIFNNCFKLAFVDTYFFVKMCNEVVTDPTNAIFAILNFDTLSWDENLSDRYEIPVDMWPDIKFPGDVVGELNTEAASELGLPNNLPVIMGGGDQQCAALGLGALNPGQAKITMGTGTFVDYIVEKPIKPAGDIPIFTFPSPVKGLWMIEGAMPGTGTIMKWFKDNFSQLQVKECIEKNQDVYALLSSEAEKIPPGSEGLLFIPLYVFRKGTIHGLGLNHTRAHMIRAIMESAALSAQMYLQMLEAMGGGKVSEVKADGGAMNSSLWAQILSDITGKTVLIPEVKDGAALGAAILGFVSQKIHVNIEKAVDSMVRFVDKKEPIKANAKPYKKLNRIFMPALLEIYDKKRVTKDL